MKVFPLTIWLLVGSGVIAAQTRENDPQQANLPAAASVQRTAVSSAPTETANAGVQIAAPTATPAPAAQPIDVPPVPPEVTFRDGKITLTAPNSTLASVLNAISSKTGIEFEGADLGAADRLALSIGPASEADVLAAIFDGSRFDYVALGRPDSPSIVQRVILITKHSVTQASYGPQPRAAQPSNAEADPDTAADNAADEWQTPGERVDQRKQMLEQDRQQELKLRELYLQQQKQQQNSQTPK